MEIVWKKMSWQIRLLELVCLILGGYDMTGGRSFFLLPEVRLKSLFLHLSCIVAFMVSFPVAVIDGHC